MRHDTQTLVGMTTGALKEHYDEVKADYLKRSGKDGRLESYLMTVNSYLQMADKKESVE